MNSLVRYEELKAQMRPGDLIAFWGKGLLSSLIRLFAGGGPSHMAVVRQGSHHGSDVQIIESTIMHNRDGVQSFPLSTRITEYDKGGVIAWIPLRDDIRQDIDWHKFYQFCGATEDHVRYGKGELFEFLVRSLPVLGTRVFQGEDNDRMVCSAFVAALWKYSGLLRGINFEKVTPQDLVEMNLYSRCEPLIGSLPKIRAFNTK